MTPGSPDMHQPNWKIFQIHTNSLFFSYSIVKELQENLPDSVWQAKNNGEIYPAGWRKWRCSSTWHWQPLFSTKMAAAASFSYKIGGGGLIFLQNWQRRPHFTISYKTGGGGKDLATLLADVLTWSGYWLEL